MSLLSENGHIKDAIALTLIAARTPSFGDSHAVLSFVVLDQPCRGAPWNSRWLNCIVRFGCRAPAVINKTRNSSTTFANRRAVRKLTREWPPRSEITRYRGIALTNAGRALRPRSPQLLDQPWPETRPPGVRSRIPLKLKRLYPVEPRSGQLQSRLRIVPRQGPCAFFIRPYTCEHWTRFQTAAPFASSQVCQTNQLTQ
jgi:hypothetical protein